ncbi:MAG: glycerophosphodiester phosphodiesterase [Angustibacter sp.]
MAHRGFSLDGLENTMTAFAAAVGLGLHYVETDVHATRDGVVVAFHDSVLDRVSDGRGSIADLTWADLRSVRVGGAEVVPRLADLLDAWPDLRVNVDVKDWPAVTPLADVLHAAGALHRVCVASFDDRRSAAVARLVGPGLATSLGRGGVLRWWLAAAAGVPRRGAPVPSTAVALQVPAAAGPLPVVTARSVAHAHRLGLHVHVWTVNEADQMHRLLDLGVDGLISDRADTLSQVLTQRAARTA